MLARALGWVSGNVYKPRNLALLRSMDEEKANTLHGCILIPQAQKYLRISREFAPVSKLEVCCPEIWDYRFSAPGFDKNHFYTTSWTRWPGSLFRLERNWATTCFYAFEPIVMEI